MDFPYTCSFHPMDVAFRVDFELPSFWYPLLFII